MGDLSPALDAEQLEDSDTGGDDPIGSSCPRPGGRWPVLRREGSRNKIWGSRMKDEYFLLSLPFPKVEAHPSSKTAGG